MIGLRRLRNSRTVRISTVAAILSFSFFLRPHCGLIDTADAAGLVQRNAGGDEYHGHGYPVQSDLCPSLDHAPIALAQSESLTATGAPQTQPSVYAVIFGGGVDVVTRRDTPPPEVSLALYLRYAHLLI